MLTLVDKCLVMMVYGGRDCAFYRESNCWVEMGRHKIEMIIFVSFNSDVLVALLLYEMWLIQSGKEGYLCSNMLRAIIKRH